MYKIQCSTFFDITATGVQTHRWNQSSKIFTTDGGCIDTEEKFRLCWQQQSNCNTVQQILLLRALPENITVPCKQDNVWRFSFEIPQIAAVAWGLDPVGALRYDANNVPMVIGLTEYKPLPEYLVSYGDDCNIWFEIISTK